MLGASAFGEAVVRFRAKYDEFTKGLDSMGDQTDDLSKRLGRVGDAFEKLGTRFMVTGGVIAAGLGLAAKGAIDFEAAFTGVRKTVDASEEEYAKLSKGLRDMSKEVPMTAVELAKVAEAAGQMGIKKNDILDFTKVVSDMSVSTNLIGEEGATMLAQFANRTHTAQDAFRNLGSAITALGNDGASTEKEILDMGLRIAGAGTVAGMSQGSILGIANALASVGINSEMGGSAISQLITKISQYVSEGAGELDTFAKVSGKTRAQFVSDWKNDAAGALVNFIVGMTKTKDAGGDLFKVLQEIGVDGIRLKDTLLSASISSDGFTHSIELGNKAYAEHTALEIEAQKFYDTTAAKLQIMRNKFQDIAISVGNVLLPTINELIKALNVDAFAKWIEGHPEEFAQWVERIAKLAGGLLIFGAASKALGMFINVMSGLASLPKLASDAATSIGKIGEFLGKLPGTAGSAISTVISTVQKIPGALTTVFTKGGGTIAQFMGNVLKSIGGFPAALEGILRAGIEQFKQFGFMAVRALAGTILKIQELPGLLRNIPNLVRGIGPLFTSMASSAVAAIGSVVVAAQAMWAALAVNVAANPLAWIAIAAVGAVAALGAIAYSAYKTKEAYKQLEESNKALADKTDAFAERLREAGRITDEQALKIKNLTDASEKYDAAMKAINDNNRARFAELDAQLATELQALLGRNATLEEMNKARLAAYELGNDARKAAIAVSLDLSTQEINTLNTGTEAERQSIENRIAYKQKYLDQAKMTTPQLIDLTNQELQQMGVVNMTEQEFAAGKQLAAQNEITLMDGVLAYRYGFTQQQIDLIGQQSIAEIQAMSNTNVARKQTVAEEAADLATRMQNVQAFLEWNTQRLAEVETERHRLLDVLKGLNEEEHASDQSLSTEKQVLRSQTFEQLSQLTAQEKQLRKDHRDMAVAYEQQVADKAAESIGVEKELTRSRLQDGEAQKIALEELSSKHKEYVDQVLSSNAQAKQSFEDSSRATQAEITGTIAMWAQSGTSVEDASKKWQDAYRKLPPSGGDGNPLDQARKDFGSFGDAVRTTAENTERAMREGVHESLGFLAPSKTGSPAPLAVAFQDFADYKTHIDELASSTESATRRMADAWVTFGQNLRNVARDAYENMKYMDPNVRHSPSLVESTGQGAGEMLRVWEGHAKNLLPIMMQAYDAMTYLDPTAHHSPSLLETLIAGNALLTDTQRRMLEQDYYMFVQHHAQMLQQLRDYLKAQSAMGGKGGDWKDGDFLKTKGLDVGAYLTMLNDFKSIMGGDPQGTLESLLLTTLEQEGKQQDEAAKEREKQLEEERKRREDMANMQQQTPQADPQQEPPPPPLPDPKVVRTVQGVMAPPGYLPDPLTTQQALAAALQGIINGGASSGSMTDIQKFLAQLRGGNVAPDALPDLPGMQLGGGTNNSIQVTINIETVRTDEDIAKIAMKTAVELDRAMGRNRR